MRIRPLWRGLAIATGLAVSTLFTYLAVRDVDWGSFADALSDSAWEWLVPALAVLALSVVMRAMRWRLLFREETRPPLGATLRALLIALCLNSILPARPGEAVRVLVLHEEVGTSRLEAIGTAVTERLQDVLALLLLLLVAAPWLPEVTWLDRAVVAAVVLMALLVVAAAILVRWEDRPLRIILRPLARLPGGSRERADRAARNLSIGLVSLRRIRIAAPAFALTLASILVISASFWLVMRALRLDIAFGAALLTMIATNLAMIIPSSPAAIGVFEAATLVALKPYGIDESRALSYAVVLHAVNVVPFVVIGLALIHRQGAHLLRGPRLRT